MDARVSIAKCSQLLIASSQLSISEILILARRPQRLSIISDFPSCVLSELDSPDNSLILLVVNTTLNRSFRC
jgi:hypothetical protein